MPLQHSFDGVHHVCCLDDEVQPVAHGTPKQVDLLHVLVRGHHRLVGHDLAIESTQAHLLLLARLPLAGDDFIRCR